MSVVAAAALASLLLVTERKKNVSLQYLAVCDQLYKLNSKNVRVTVNGA